MKKFLSLLSILCILLYPNIMYAEELVASPVPSIQAMGIMSPSPIAFTLSEVEVKLYLPAVCDDVIMCRYVDKALYLDYNEALYKLIQELDEGERGMVDRFFIACVAVIRDDANMLTYDDVKEQYPEFDLMVYLYSPTEDLVHMSLWALI